MKPPTQYGAGYPTYCPTKPIPQEERDEINSCSYLGKKEGQPEQQALSVYPFPLRGKIHHPEIWFHGSTLLPFWIIDSCFPELNREYALDLSLSKKLC
jgi:hypothetical protein